MHPERWQRIKEILDRGLRLDPKERVAYLDRVCEGDQELSQEVRSLIEAYDEAGEVFEAPPPSLADALIGSMLGPYRVIDLIGTGGMGSVYRARRADEAFEKEVAVKLVRRGL